MKRNLVLGGVVVALLAAVLVMKCGGGGKTEHTTSSSTSTTGSGGAAGKAAARDKHVDLLTLQKASISGTVTDEVTKAPLPGARVCGDASSLYLSGQFSREPSCTTSDAAGAYTLKDLVPASYRIGASAKTYRPGNHHPGGNNNATQVGLAAGEAKTGIDVKLRPGGVEVTGTVSDITGGPVAAASVRADANWGDTAPPVETDANGKFSMWVAPGRLSVVASAEGYAPGSEFGRAPGTFDVLLTPESSVAGTVVDAVTNEPVAGVQVTLRGADGSWDPNGDPTDVTDDKGGFRINRLAPGRYNQFARSPHGQGRGDGSTLVGLGQHVDGVTIRLHAGIQITGKVMRADKTVCVESEVTLVDSKQDRWARTRTEPDGLVHADGVLPGTYEVEASCDGALSREKYDPVTVTDKDIKDLVWEVDAGATIHGRVVTKAGEPVSDAWVTSRETGGPSRKRSNWTYDRTALDGTYTLKGVRPGKHSLEVNTDKGIGPAEGWPVEVAAAGTTEKELVLDAGGTLAGSVVDTAGKPVPGVSVRANAFANRATGYSNTNAKTGTDGTFTMDGLVPGEYRVTAQRARAGTLRKPGSTDDSKQGERATVVAGKTASVKIIVEAQTGIIKGSVVDVSGAPAVDAFVSAARESDSAGASPQSATSAARWSDRKPVITAVDGTFTIGDLSPGSYTLRAFIRGGGEAFAEHVPVGTTTKLQLKPTGSIAGTVTSPVGVIEEITIELRSKTGFWRREAFFRTKGVFTMRDLPGGSFTLTASDASGKKQLELELADGETKAGVTIALDALVTLTGRVIDAVTKQPVAGISMSAGLAKDGGMSMRGGPGEKNITGDDGRFEIEKAPIGSVALRGWPKDYQYSDYNGVATVREVSGTGSVDVGDVPAYKRRVKQGEKAGELGVKFADDPPGTPVDKRIYKVSFIDPAGPAAKSGLVVGDVVTSIDGNNITGADTLNAWMFMQAPPGTKLVFGLQRGATVSVVLAQPN